MDATKSLDIYVDVPLEIKMAESLASLIQKEYQDILSLI